MIKKKSYINTYLITNFKRFLYLKCIISIHDKVMRLYTCNLFYNGTQIYFLGVEMCGKILIKHFPKTLF